VKKYFLEVQALKKKIQEEDDHTKKLVDASNEREQKAIKEREALQQKPNDEVQAQVAAYNTEMNYLKAKLESNMKMMEHLRRENKKAKKVCGKEEGKFGTIKKNHKRLSLVFDESFSTLGDLEGSFNVLGDTNQQLSDNRERATEEHRELKEKVHKAQTMYMEVAEQRLEHQKTLAYILNCIGDDCNKNALIEETFRIGNECEVESSFVMEALDKNPDAQFTNLKTASDESDEQPSKKYLPDQLDESSRTTATWADSSDRSLTLDPAQPSIEEPLKNLLNPLSLCDW
jgi:chromosome segregation ATPase